ncbi:hypothetical protein VB780_03265 [Leptolyngbya sp. CCNP1308]|uniref:hypothetical protein n=1 Tax=Leptolyngbya sp. CCNP1308 TaxID=3110255 RepID=UPI002B21F127|nr:hypothetical protein [Leptolyngbya sp. CCNP1308]MEA5447573.1 hypothetical protein [Leptolyngbya sp. CCNP1308]
MTDFILSRDEVILRQVGDLDPATTINDSDELAISQGGAVRKTNLGDIFASVAEEAVEDVEELRTEILTALGDYVNTGTDQSVAGVKTFTDGPRVTKAAGTAAELRLASGTSDRWTIEKNNTAESGSNAGSNFVISSINDDGTTKTAALTITRSNRAIALSGTLSVAQAVTLSSTLAVTGNATIGGTLGVTGASTLASVGVTGNATVGGTLGVTGNTTVGGTLAVTGQVTVPTPSGNANAARKENVDLVQSNLDTHAALTNNPHTVTPAQVGNTTAQWNADKLQGTNIQAATPTDGQVLIYSSANSRWEPQTSALNILPQPVGSVIHLPYAVTLTNGVWQDSSGWYWLGPIGLTIGNASSGATYANALAEKLFLALWANVAISGWSILTSTGSASTAGASAAADWAANKRITIPDMRGRDIIAAGAGSGLTGRFIGTRGGAETHSLDANENGAHVHGVNDPGHVHSMTVSRTDPGTGTDTQTIERNGSFLGPQNYAINGAFTGVSIQNSGSGAPHNNMQPWKAYFELWFMGERS